MSRSIKSSYSFSKNYDKETQQRESTVGCCWTKVNIFAQESSMPGIWHIVRNDRHWLSRTVWFLAFTICFTAGTFFITEAFVRYLSYDVKTTRSEELVPEIEFPAVTICNENLAKRSIVGLNDKYLKSFAAFTSYSPVHYIEKLRVITAQCAHNDTTDSTILEELRGGFGFISKYGISKALRIISHDSEYSVVKCWWKNEEIDCSGRFLNHVTDHGFCFTLNPSSHLLSAYSLGMGPYDNGYGIDKNYQMLKLNSTGFRNNMRLMLNAHQDDYCVTNDDTAGFKVIVHDPQVQPLFFLDRPIHLPPGFETHIGIRFRRQVKYTQHLNKCVDFMKLDMYPNAAVYFKEACYLECFARFVQVECQCLPPYSPPESTSIRKLANVTICFVENAMLCMKKYERIFFGLGMMASRCPNCADPCNKTEFEFQISSSYFPAKNSFSSYNLTLPNASSLQEMREDYLMVNFYVESLLISVITETQAFGLDQLVADIGGQLGFFLGMSVLSLVEFILFIMPDKESKDNFTN